MNRATRRRQEAERKRSGATTGRGGKQAPAVDPHAEVIQRALRAQQAGRRDEAVTLYRSVLERDRDHAAANHFLGLLHHQAGNIEEGGPLIARSLELAPDNPEFHNNAGIVLSQIGQFERAVERLRRAVELKPDYAVAWNNLASAQAKLERFDEAIESGERALALQASYTAARWTLANTLKAAGRMEAAADAYRRVLEREPNAAEVHYQLAMTEMEAGRIAEASESFRRTTVLKPRHADAHLMLALVRKPHEMDDEMAAMERLYARADATRAERMLLAFALAKSLEDIGRYDEAFDYLLAGNAARRETIDYDPAATRRDFKEVRRVFSAEFFASLGDGHGDPDTTPVFVMGMPRSGTSLVEQIVAAHPQIAGRGEILALQQTASRFFAQENAMFPENLGSIAPETFRAAGEAYVASLRANVGPALRVSDKMPGNFLFVGLIRAILPNATLLHCVREAPATCLSIFKTYFRSTGHKYAYNLDELAEFYVLYAQLMAHWQAVLPGFVTDVRYEELVADQEAQSRRLIAATGLEWDERCLAFQDAKHPVRTASAAQVRQPIYSSSVKLWQRYEKGLAPLIGRLAENDVA
ncbi:tetratricopeptide repeat-containing sulfotransferase family protein [Pararhizobium mangrovi]|uniref:Tetratricopeptide repeat protein n=1 Tax=Pararhizobium mangrovi TaxID=2590452 RepID=A0A506U6P1_9HYPH|nr:tetratricopeptide repeat-containing sulfotransferase family protein [Pararhizobium mangrovi]TPW28734.1 tetratricopeptide repeat protein [Pararhizobium mangrovi]